jgi:hypothetical protein
MRTQAREDMMRTSYFNRGLLTLFIIGTIFLGGCTIPNFYLGSLNITISEASGAKAVSYQISGTGPGGDVFQRATSTPKATIVGLEKGDWLVSVDGKDVDGNTVSTGSNAKTVTYANPEDLEVMLLDAGTTDSLTV